MTLFIFAAAAVFVNAEEPAVDAEAEGEVAEEEEVRRDHLSEEERSQMDASAETHQFQAEVNRLMDIIINSLYSNREVFLRELISNAADACDKIRFKSLTDKDIIGTGDDAELDIKIKFDKEAKTLTIADKGIGMTKDDLKNNLGVVAKSGTTEFLEAASKGGDAISLIGQFGVGFYSVYLVADKVTVASRHASSAEQNIWESTANSVFTIAPDPRGQTLGAHGTEITLHLKEDAEEFLDEGTLTKLVTRYSQFINFPISLHTTRTESKEVPDDSEDEAAADADADTDSEEAKSEDDDDDMAVSDDDEAEGEKKPKMKTVTETIEEWKRLNDVKAIWTRDPKEVEEEDYLEFYKSLSKNDYEKPMNHVHFKAEGEITFRSILYIPESKPHGLYDNMYAKQTGLKLFVRRVLISDEFDDFLPSYLNFVKGIVDSDDLPLNVSRETLAQSRVLKVMAKKLTRKVLEMLKNMADKESNDDEEEEDDEEAAAEDKETKEAEEEQEEGEDKKEEEKPYSKFWNEYGKSIKLGVIQDRKNKSKLTKLLRFTSSKTEEGQFTSFEDYVDGMPENQKKIYFVTCETMAMCKNAPSAQKLLKKGFEVLYLDDPLDEYVVQQLTEFDGVDLQSAAKESLKFGNEDSKAFKKLGEEFKGLTDWLKETLGSKIEKATVSNRLTTSPAVLVTAQYGWSGNMERIMKAQALGDTESHSWQAPKKTLEINARHPIMQELKKRVEADKDDEAMKDIATLIYDTSLMTDGFVMDDPQKFSEIITRVVTRGLDVEGQAVDEDVDLPEDEEEEEEEAAEEEEEEEVVIDATSE